MHLTSPYLTTKSRKKSKQKFRSSAAAKLAREAAQEWEDLKIKWNVPKTSKKSKVTTVDLPTSRKVYIRDTGDHAKSLNEWVTGAVSSKSTQQYTGTLIKGIATMHKSNAVPVINEQQAVEISHMRR